MLSGYLALKSLRIFLGGDKIIIINKTNCRSIGGKVPEEQQQKPVDVGSSLAYARDNCECNVKGVKSEKGI
jgi:hypothetical protein